MSAKGRSCQAFFSGPLASAFLPRRTSKGIFSSQRPSRSTSTLQSWRCDTPSYIFSTTCTCQPLSVRHEIPHQLPRVAVRLGTRPNMEIGCHDCWARSRSISPPIMLSYHAPRPSPPGPWLQESPPIGRSTSFSGVHASTLRAYVGEMALPSRRKLFLPRMQLSLSTPTMCSPTAGSLEDYIIRPSPLSDRLPSSDFHLCLFRLLLRLLTLLSCLVLFVDRAYPFVRFVDQIVHTPFS